MVALSVVVGFYPVELCFNTCLNTVKKPEKGIIAEYNRTKDTDTIDI